MLQALSDDLQSLFGGLLSPRSMLQGQHAHPKVDDPRKEDPPWLALIQQLVDGYTYCPPLPTTAHRPPLPTAHCPLLYWRCGWLVFTPFTTW